MRAALLYAEPLSELIHKMKYEDMFALAGPLADLMLRSWPDWAQPIDLVVPIPLHPERRKKRGYNQSELLARRLGEEQNLPVSSNALARIRHTPPQVGLNGTERLMNVQGAFAAHAEVVSGKYILLIDDVFTTGATMSAAATALFSSGAAGVSGYCVARTP